MGASHREALIAAASATPSIEHPLCGRRPAGASLQPSWPHPPRKLPGPLRSLSSHPLPRPRPLMLRALRQAAGLAARHTPAATLAETGACASLAGAPAALQVAAAQAAPLGTCRAAAAAAAQPWLRGVHAWAARPPAQICTAAAAPALRGRCLSQQRAASAQAAEVASSAASSSGNTLTLSDGAVERLKELAAKVGDYATLL